MWTLIKAECSKHPHNDEQWYDYFMIEQGPPLSLTVSLICLCGVLLLVIGIPIIAIIVRKDVGKSDTEDKL